MQKTTAITRVYLYVGGVLLRAGWDRVARKQAAMGLKPDLSEMEDRHHLTFDVTEEGKPTLEENLGRVVFCEKRPFTAAQS
ncbi:MAG: hypothetical protein JXL20_05255 [Deltaproteobacteria bacterium]|nr:hypothetical protein [Deltaproteobacteria bacterium]